MRFMGGGGRGLGWCEDLWHGSSAFLCFYRGLSNI